MIVCFWRPKRRYRAICRVGGWRRSWSARHFGCTAIVWTWKAAPLALRKDFCQSTRLMWINLCIWQHRHADGIPTNPDIIVWFKLYPWNKASVHNNFGYLINENRKIITTEALQQTWNSEPTFKSSIQVSLSKKPSADAPCETSTRLASSLSAAIMLPLRPAIHSEKKYGWLEISQEKSAARSNVQVD